MTSLFTSSTSSLCLSSATILRCASLTRLENFLILIPTVLEVIFSTSLLFIFWNSAGRRHLLLSAEGWVYLTLAILEMLSHILPAARENLDFFTAFDLAIGVASFLPLFFYTFFLYLFAHDELLHSSTSTFSTTPSVAYPALVTNNSNRANNRNPNNVSPLSIGANFLPTRLAKIISLLLLIFVPTIVSVNELASFVGVERRSLPTKPPQIFIGFTSPHLFTLNTFFSSLTLALVTLFQAIVFLVAFCRLVLAVVRKRRYERERERLGGEDRASLVKGTPYLTLGLKLGAIETVIGFAGGGLGIIVTRRGMRMLSRAFLCIGLSKGIDTIEDFQTVRQELTSANSNSKFLRRTSRTLLNLLTISNPRTSTFRPLSPSAREFHASLPKGHLFPASPIPRQRAVGLGLSRTEGQESGAMQQFASLRAQSKSQRQKVTVHYKQGGGAPRLEMRFSDVDLPSASGFTAAAVAGSISDVGYTGDDKERYGEKGGYEPSMISVGGLVGFGYGSAQQQRLSQLQTQNQTQPQTRYSTPSSFVDSTNGDGEVEIVSAPQRTLSQRSARARMLVQAGGGVSRDGTVKSVGTGVSGDRDADEEDSSDMSEKQQQYQQRYQYSPRQAYPYPSPNGYTQSQSQSQNQYQPQSQSQLYSLSNTPINPAPTTTTTTRIRSEYTSITPSLPEALLAVRELAKRFPGPPITYNGRPLVGGIGQDRYSLWARESVFDSAPASVVGEDNHDTRAGVVYGNRMGSVIDGLGLDGSDMLDTPTASVSIIGSYMGSYRGSFEPGRRESFAYIPRALGSPRELLEDNRQTPAAGRVRSEWVDSVQYAGGRRVSKMDSPRIVISHDGVETDPEASQIPAAFNRTQNSQRNVMGSGVGLGGPVREFGLTPKPSFMSTVSTSSSYARPIDPFDSDIDDNESAKFPIAQRVQMVPFVNPVVANMSVPNLNANVPLRPKINTSNTNLYTIEPKHNVSVPTSPEENTPVTIVSGYTPSLASATSSTPGTADMFSELAVRTGGSRDLKRGSTVDSAGNGAGAGNLRSRASGSMGQWNAEEITLPMKPAKAVMVAPNNNSSSSLVTTDGVGNKKRGSRRPPSNITWVTTAQEKTGEMVTLSSSQPPTTRTLTDEEHRRQRSVDAAAHVLSNSIPWLKNPEMEEEERELAKAISSANLKTRRPKLSRFKSIGNAPHRSTPAPVQHPSAMRGSLHIEPIMIPPTAHVGTLEAVQGSVSDTASVLRDSSVFGVDDMRSAMKREQAKPAAMKQGNYF